MSRGLNQDAPCLEACRFPFDAPRSVRPQCIFLFWCLKLVEEKEIGVIKNFFWKIRIWIFFFFKKFSIQKKNFFLFFQIFSRKMIFFVKFEFSMIWAFIYCTYWMCLKKELDFQKFSYQIWANFHYESTQFRLGRTEKLDKLECWSLILQTTGDPNFHLRPCIQVLSEK